MSEEEQKSKACQSQKSKTTGKGICCVCKVCDLYGRHLTLLSRPSKFEMSV